MEIIFRGCIVSLIARTTFARVLKYISESILSHFSLSKGVKTVLMLLTIL